LFARSGRGKHQSIANYAFILMRHPRFVRHMRPDHKNGCAPVFVQLRDTIGHSFAAITILPGKRLSEIAIQRPGFNGWFTTFP